MKKLLFLYSCVSITFFSFGQSSSNDYHLSWDGSSSVLKVQLDYMPNNKDSTVFEYGNLDFGGQLDIFKVVKNISCNKADKVKINEKDRRITVYHQGVSKKKLTYEIDGQLQQKDKKANLNSELFRPVVTKGFLSLINIFFMMKRIGTSDEKVSVVWDKYPKGFTYFNSVLPENSPAKKENFNINSGRLLLYVMGENIAVNKYDVNGIPYFSVTSNEEDYKDLKKQLPPFFKDYFPSIRAFWQDNNAPFYFLAILPVKYAGISKGGGFGIDNGFVMKYLGDFTFGEKRVVAHETSHNWIGLKLQIGDDSFDNQWFGEGFNDYVCLINLAKSKVFSQAEFLTFLNDNNFKTHYTSTVKDSTNASIAKNYWKDYQNFGTLPYRRGLIYAFYLDNQIRLASDGKFTLRNLLLDIFHLQQTKKEHISIDEFIELGSKYISKEQLINEIEIYMIQGKPIDFKTVKLISEFQIYFIDNIPQIKLKNENDLENIYIW